MARMDFRDGKVLTKFQIGIECVEVMDNAERSSWKYVSACLDDVANEGGDSDDPDVKIKQWHSIYLVNDHDAQMYEE